MEIFVRLFVCILNLTYGRRTAIPLNQKISLDTASYKLYYVNYEMKLNSEPVDCLCNPRETPLTQAFPLLGCR
jgi:hypothetical protein